MFGLEHADNEEEQWSDDFVSTYFGVVGGYCSKFSTSNNNKSLFFNHLLVVELNTTEMLSYLLHQHYL